MRLQNYGRRAIRHVIEIFSWNSHLVRRSITYCAVIACICTSAVSQQFRGYWPAVSSTAMAITGDISLSSERIIVNFHSFVIADIRRLTPDELAAVFSAEQDTSGATGELYRVTVPAATKMLHKNTLCGSSDVQWMVLDQRGNSLSLAFFSGAKAPALTVDELNNSTNLCGTFSYRR